MMTYLFTNPFPRPNGRNLFEPTPYTDNWHILVNMIYFILYIQIYLHLYLFHFFFLDFILSKSAQRIFFTTSKELIHIPSVSRFPIWNRTSVFSPSFQSAPCAPAPGTCLQTSRRSSTVGFLSRPRPLTSLLANSFFSSGRILISFLRNGVR